MYVVGYKLGRVWAGCEASQAQLEQLKSLEDGRSWVREREDPVSDLRQLVDPADTGFLDLDEPPAPIFVAGFVDGVRSIE